MASTVEKVIGSARYLIADTRVPYRYPQEQALDAYNLAMADVWRMRPDLFIGKYASGVPEVLIADIATAEFPLGSQWLSPVLSFIAGWVEMSDDEFTIDGRAAMLQQRFQSTLLVGG